MTNYWLTCSTETQLKMLCMDDIIKDKRISTLDSFTSKFKNEDELKLFLVENNFIDSTLAKGKISIVYRANKKINYLEVFYSNMKKYIDYDYLLHIMYSLTNDINFLNKLIGFYSMVNQRLNPQFSNILSLSGYVNTLKSNQDNSELRENIYYVINSIVKKATTKVVDSNMGQFKENYRGLRDLGLFVYHYINKKEKQAKSVPPNIETAKELHTHFNHYVSINNETLDDELLFPPNSSEEKMYLEYLEELDAIAEEETIIDEKGHPYCR